LAAQELLLRELLAVFRVYAELELMYALVRSLWNAVLLRIALEIQDSLNHQIYAMVLMMIAMGKPMKVATAFLEIPKRAE